MGVPSSGGVSVSRRTRLQLSPVVYGAFTLCGGPFQNLQLDFLRCGLLRFRSPLLADCFLFLRVLRCFSSPGSLLGSYVFTSRYVGMPPRGFPHSDISVSPAAHASTELFVVYHVLHRHLTPRHSPCALVAFFFTCCRELVLLSSRYSLLHSLLLLFTW